MGTTPITLLSLIQPLGGLEERKWSCGGVGDVAHPAGYHSSLALLPDLSPCLPLPSGMLVITTTDLGGGSYNRNSGDLG